MKVSDPGIDETVIVSANDLSVLMAFSNTCTWTTYNYGRDELRNYPTFPVTVQGKNYTKYMRDSGTGDLPEVIIYSGSKSDSNIPRSAWGYLDSWTDQHQISAYTTMRTVIKWWKDTFGRDSLDGKGMTVNLVTHASDMSDNACWSSGSETISVGDIGNSSLYDHTRAIGLDTLAHETGHAVLYYVTGGIPYRNATVTATPRQA
ncbi:MAG: hypothetical protein IJG37_02785 [Synergistaceae bacterium]|nr:hypothetical protein [Synergistaceae bacterium]MBQ6971945.1 hypothetical protein [Synergistaceae bacterium]